jgi:hypothetical protein
MTALRAQNLAEYHKNLSMTWLVRTTESPALYSVRMLFGSADQAFAFTKNLPGQPAFSFRETR